jgi:hypothetical protein
VQRLRRPLGSAMLAAALLLCALHAHAFVVTVDANATPWVISINPLYAFGSGTPLPPAVVNNTDVPFAAGDHLAINVLDGLVSAFPPDYPLIDANGKVVMPGNDPNAYVGPVNDSPGSSGNGFPSKFMGPYPPDINLMELVGTFADSAGVIVGTPFFVGPSRTLVVPAGATRLQLGLNDDVFNDNGGAFRVEVTVSNVPEPQTLALIAVGLGIVVVVAKRRRG